MRPSSGWWAVLLVSTGVLLVGCGSSDDDDGSQTLATFCNSLVERVAPAANRDGPAASVLLEAEVDEAAARPLVAEIEALDIVADARYVTADDEISPAPPESGDPVGGIEFPPAIRVTVDEGVTTEQLDRALQPIADRPGVVDTAVAELGGSAQGPRAGDVLVAPFDDVFAAHGMTIYLQPDAGQALADIAAETAALPGIGAVEQLTQADAYEEFAEVFASTPELVESVSPEALPPSVRAEPVDATAAARVRTRWQDDPHVFEVVSSGEQAARGIAMLVKGTAEDVASQLASEAPMVMRDEVERLASAHGTLEATDPADLVFSRGEREQLAAGAEAVRRFASRECRVDLARSSRALLAPS